MRPTSLLGISLCMAVLAPSLPAWSEPLTGDVGAAYSTAEATDVNPANAGFVDHSQIMFSPELFKQESISVRYPNFEPITQADSGLGSFLVKPAFIVKPTASLGIGGYLIPPLPMKIGIQKEKLPVVVLGTLNYVDLEGSGQLNGAGQATVGYRMNDKFGVGFNASFQSISFEAKLTPSDGGEPLATVTGETSEINVGAGVRFDPSPGRFAAGAAFGLVNIAKNDIKVDSPLMGEATGGDSASGQGSGGTGASVSNPLNSFLVGMQVALTPRFRLLADFKYTRANKEQRTFSLVDLKEKNMDVHDTLGVRTGAIVGFDSTTNLLFGFRYEPASLGAGSPGEDGLAGFGTIELFKIFAGFDSLTPYWQLGMGMQKGFEPQTIRRPGKGRKSESEVARGYYKWTVAVGFAYRRASLGIDENGELPGAYLYKKTYIPASLTYKF